MRAIIKHRWLFGAVFVVGLALAVFGFISQRSVSDEDKQLLLAQPNGELRAHFVTSTPQLLEYVEVISSCGPYWGDDCLNVRSGPGEEYPKVAQLRTGAVLRVGTHVINSAGKTWYQIVFDEQVRYPERIIGEWYVSADYVRPFFDIGPRELPAEGAVSSTKRIIVDRSEQTLYAYDGETLFAKEPISTGLDLTPTPRGTFTVYRMSPTRYMQGPLPGVSDQYYDLPGVPWNLYFTEQGGVVHGAYWHDKFGQPWSHGCVNLPPDTARQLYEWADLGMTVTVKD